MKLLDVHLVNGKFHVWIHPAFRYAPQVLRSILLKVATDFYDYKSSPLDWSPPVEKEV